MKVALNSKSTSTDTETDTITDSPDSTDSMTFQQLCQFPTLLEFFL